MDKRSEKVATAAESTTKRIDRASLRPWVAPTFERVSLKEAMAGAGGGAFDGVGCS
jgi:hypothetical protein